MRELRTKGNDFNLATTLEQLANLPHLTIVSVLAVIRSKETQRSKKLVALLILSLVETTKLAYSLRYYRNLTSEIRQEFVEAGCHYLDVLIIEGGGRNITKVGDFIVAVKDFKPKPKPKPKPEQE